MYQEFLMDPQIGRGLFPGGSSVDRNNNQISGSGEFPLGQCTHSVSVRYRCIPCGVKLCPDCLSRSHGKCEFTIEPAYLLKTAANIIKENQVDVNSLARRVKRSEMAFARQIEQARQLVTERCDQLKSYVDEEKEALLRKMALLEKAKVEMWKERLGQCRSATQDLSRWSLRDQSSLRDINNISTTVTRAKINDPEDDLDDIHFEVANSRDLAIGTLRLPPSAKNSTVDLQGSVHAEGTHTCIVTVRNALDELVSGDADYAVSVALFDEELDPVRVLVENLQNGQYKITFLPLQEGKFLLSVSLNSLPIRDSPMEIEVLAARTTHIPKLVFGEEGNGDGQLCRAWGVCCDARGRILVADRCNHRIQIFAPDGRFIGKFGTEGSEPGKLNRPAGLAVDQYSRIIVADKDNHRIQIFDSQGLYITHFGKFDSPDDSLCYPWDVAVNGDCNIAVTESKQFRVRLFTDTGIELRRFCFKLEMGLECPRGISCTTDGSFIVSDFNKHKLVMLDRRFQNPKTFGSEGKDLMEFFRPQSVAVSPSGMIAVADCKNHRVQIFNGSGVKVIGRHGTNLGEFDALQGIAFHPNGSLVVVDFGNSRIQVFDV